MPKFINIYTLTLTDKMLIIVTEILKFHILIITSVIALFKLLQQITLSVLQWYSNIIIVWNRVAIHKCYALGVDLIIF